MKYTVHPCRGKPRGAAAQLIISRMKTAHIVHPPEERHFVLHMASQLSFTLIGHGRQMEQHKTSSVLRKQNPCLSKMTLFFFFFKCISSHDGRDVNTWTKSNERHIRSILSTQSSGMSAPLIRSTVAQASKLLPTCIIDVMHYSCSR